MAHSGSDHFLKLALRLGKLIPKVMCPVPEQDHGARIFIILNIYNRQSYDLTCMVGVLEVKNLIFLVIQLFIWIDYAIEPV